jgi:ribosomal protein S18 acetylase RimI-like enzyme
MPPLTDKDQIRAILCTDPPWSIFALGDLSPRMFPKTRWFTPDLTMVLHDYGTSILFAMGTASVREALEHVSWPVHLQVQPDALNETARHAIITSRKHMWRMAWRRGETHRDDRVTRLTAADLGPLKELYADGESAGESPDFFHDSMVGDGVFFGVFEGRQLVAAAGTHLIARDEGVAALGNIYTRRDRRGRGLGRLVTGAVLHEFRAVETVGLSVRADNAPAIRVYESLGFVKHCEFYEALAAPHSPARA